MCLHENILYENVFVLCKFYMVKISFSYCIELPSGTGILPMKFFQLYKDVVQRKTYFKAFEVCKHILNKPIHICYRTQLYYRN